MRTNLQLEVEKLIARFPKSELLVITKDELLVINQALLTFDDTEVTGFSLELLLTFKADLKYQRMLKTQLLCPGSIRPQFKLPFIS